MSRFNPLCPSSLQGTLESAKLRALRAKNVIPCQRALCAYVPTCLRALCAYVLTCQRALRGYVLTCLVCLRAHVPTCFACSRTHMPCVLTCSCANAPCALTCSRGNVLVFMPVFSVSLPLLLKLYRLLVRFKSLITAFAQWREFIYKPSLLITCRLERREYRWDAY